MDMVTAVFIGMGAVVVYGIAAVVWALLASKKQDHHNHKASPQSSL